MDKLAIVFLQTDISLSIENCISTFLENNKDLENIYCIHQTKIENKLENVKYILIQYENYKYIEQIIDVNLYDYLVLLPNNYIIDKALPLEMYINIFRDNLRLGQIQFLKDSLPYKHLPDIINHPIFRYQSYKQIFENPINHNIVDSVPYIDYINNNYYTVFKLEPSIINIQNTKLKTHIPIFPNTLYQRVYNILYTINNITSFNVDLELHKNTQSIEYTPLKNQVTIVTAFIRVNNASKKHKYDYVECAKKTLSLPNPMVIYISEELYDTVKTIRSELGLLEKTKIITLTLNDFYMYDQKALLDKCCVKNKSPYNNSLYIMSVNSRYSYLEKAINSNYFNTEYYGWVDFGINHIVGMDPITEITYNNPLHVRIAWIARKNLDYNHKCLGGGIFIAHKHTMKHLCNLHDLEFRYNLSLGHCINDDKTLFFIFLKYPELFDIYFSGYNCLYEKLLT
jgi:hypothetical protein